MDNLDVLNKLIQEELKPLVKRIDAEAFYPENFLHKLAGEGFFKSSGLTKQDYLPREVSVVEEIAKVCMTTAFNVWCHLASLTYIRNSNNAYLKDEILPLLENGTLLGGTGLSNPMKYYAKMETLHLKAECTRDGYVITGQLPAVSNLGSDHVFGIIAEVNEDERIMALVSCRTEGLTLKVKQGYMGVNGSATYSCAFENVFIDDRWILSHSADDFVEKIRPYFILNQIPLGLGVTDASIQSIRQVVNKQAGCNQYLATQPDELLEELQAYQNKLQQISKSKEVGDLVDEIIELRRQIVYLTTKATHACMLHQGGAGYFQYGAPSRRLRESYFLVNLTPTLKHLEKYCHLEKSKLA